MRFRNEILGLVIARNSVQFKQWCKWNKVREQNYRYIPVPSRCAGIHCVPIYFAGEYWKSKMFGSDDIMEIGCEFRTWAKNNFSGC